jgi:AcrR family transcriptional regulator
VPAQPIAARNGTIEYHPVGEATMTQVLETPRLRLVGALATAAAEKGYAATTIADIVRHARVSKRTFYEHFADKEDCLLAGYQHVSDLMMAVLRESSFPPGLHWTERVRAIAAVYLGALEQLPAVNRALLLEVQAAGAEAYRLRARNQRRFAKLLCELVEEGRRSGHDEMRPLTPMLALAIVGGINELMLHAVEPDGRLSVEHPFADLLEPVTELVTAVLARP